MSLSEVFPANSAEGGGSFCPKTFPHLTVVFWTALYPLPSFTPLEGTLRVAHSVSVGIPMHLRLNTYLPMRSYTGTVHSCSWTWRKRRLVVVLLVLVPRGLASSNTIWQCGPSKHHTGMSQTMWTPIKTARNNAVNTTALQLHADLVVHPIMYIRTLEEMQVCGTWEQLATAMSLLRLLWWFWLVGCHDHINQDLCSQLLSHWPEPVRRNRQMVYRDQCRLEVMSFFLRKV